MWSIILTMWMHRMQGMNSKEYSKLKCEIELEEELGEQQEYILYITLKSMLLWIGIRDCLTKGEKQLRGNRMGHILGDRVR